MATEIELIPHLFRKEFSRLVTVLSRQFGLDYLEVAEDIASETFVAALETWPYKGMPDNPTAWLFAVARHKALNHLDRNKRHQKKLEQLSSHHSVIIPNEYPSESLFSDSQLQMLFAICHPALPPETQVGLALRILCGFGIEEIANAFLTNKDTIHKRLMRGRQKLRENQVTLEFPAETLLPHRLDAVLTTLYLLFNEGYHSESHTDVIRKELCLEAMRLTHLLSSNQATNLPVVKALLALMCFHASRLDARKNEHGELVLYDDQDEENWNQDLIAQGAYFLREAAVGTELTRYHLEASIAWWHTVKVGSPEKWQNVLRLYDQLLDIHPTPVASLNRAFAYAKVHGCKAAIDLVEKLSLPNNRYYHALLGELYWEIDGDLARIHFEKAISLACTTPDRDALKKRMLSKESC